MLIEPHDDEDEGAEEGLEAFGAAPDYEEDSQNEDLDEDDEGAAGDEGGAAGDAGDGSQPSSDDDDDDDDGDDDDDDDADHSMMVLELKTHRLLKVQQWLVAQSLELVKSPWHHSLVTRSLVTKLSVQRSCFMTELCWKKRYRPEVLSKANDDDDARSRAWLPA